MNEVEKAELSGQLTTLFSSLSFRLKLLEGVRRKLDVYIASGFNIFDYIAPDENRLSDIIAELLSPEGKHGQGNVFLREFLKTVEQDVERAGLCRVVREQPTDLTPQPLRRIDILLEMDGLGMGIENKPWAGEQPDQLAVYQEYLENKYQDNYLLVYLSGSGHEPLSMSADRRERLKREGRLKVISYPVEFRKWLEACYKECRAEKVRWFLHDFIEYVEKGFKLEPKEEKA